MSATEYYNHSSYPAQGASGSSAAMRAELELVETGFGKLPDLSGNGGKIVAVNSGATALEAVTTTGTGSAVRATSPTLVTPDLGTPSALVGTNITGTAAGLTAGVASAVAVGGITGLGTGVATALAVNVGSAGAPVVLNGVGGTPSSMTGTNITGTAAGLTAGTVTTNANLTGHVTSVGNAAVLGSFTLAQLNTAISDGDVPTAATQADQETATSTTTYVSPGRQQLHPSAAKAWVMHDAAGNVNASYNITSVTDGGTGVFQSVWATDFSSANYAMAITLQKDIASAATTLIVQANEGAQLAGGSTYTVADTTTVTARDPLSVYCIAFGDQ